MPEVHRQRAAAAGATVRALTEKALSTMRDDSIELGTRKGVAHRTKAFIDRAKISLPDERAWAHTHSKFVEEQITSLASNAAESSLRSALAALTVDDHADLDEKLDGANAAVDEVLMHFEPDADGLKQYHDVVSAKINIVADIVAKTPVTDATVGAKATSLLEKLLKCCKHGIPQLADMLCCRNAYSNLNEAMDAFAPGWFDSKKCMDEWDTPDAKNKLKILLQRKIVSSQTPLTADLQSDFPDFAVHMGALATQCNDIVQAATDKFKANANETIAEAGLQLAPICRGGKNGNSWHKGYALQTMTRDEVEQCAAKTLLAIDGKAFASMIKEFEAVLTAKKEIYELFGIGATLKDEDYVKDQSILELAVATKNTAIVWSILQNDWENGPTKVAQKRALKRLHAEMRDDGSIEMLPTVLRDKLDEVAPPTATSKLSK